MRGSLCATIAFVKRLIARWNEKNAIGRQLERDYISRQWIAIGLTILVTAVGFAVPFFIDTGLGGAMLLMGACGLAWFIACEMWKKYWPTLHPALARLLLVFSRRK